MKTFEELQADLGPFWSLNRPGSGVDHVVVVLPSFSVGESMLSHYAARIPALEHRYLVTSLMLHRIEACELVFLTCQAPGRRVLDYYASLVPWGRRGSTRARFRLAVVPDDSPRPIAAKLLDRPDIIGALRASFAGRPAFIEPWNVTEREVEVAERLQVPIDGTAPDLWHLGFKSAGRRLFREAGVPLPAGREDVRTVNGMAVAAAEIREQRPTATGVVVKLDNSAAGDGNVVIEFGDTDVGTATREEIALRGRRCRTGTCKTSPRAPSWRNSLPRPASPARASRWNFHPSAKCGSSPRTNSSSAVTPARCTPAAASRRSRLCRRAGASRAGDRRTPHAARRRRTSQCGLCGSSERHRHVAHPCTGDQPPQRRDDAPICRPQPPRPWPLRRRRWELAGRGRHAAVVLVDRQPCRQVMAGHHAGCRHRGGRYGRAQFDVRTGTGVVLHMLSCLAIDGRFGLTAIGRTPEHATDLYEATSAAVHRYAREAERVRPS